MANDSQSAEDGIESGNELRILSGRKALTYSGAVLGQLLPSSLQGAFISIFWIYIVGLNALLVGYATAAGAISNAIFSILFGVLSDNKKPTKFGKRRIFIIIGVPFLVISLIIMWIPPHVADTFGADDYGLFTYLLFCNIMFFIGFSCIRSSYLAMLPEQSQTNVNRIKISTQQGIFSIISSIIGLLLPNILISFTSNPEDIYNNLHDRAIMFKLLPILGSIFAVISIILHVILIINIQEDFLYEEYIQNNKKTFKTDIGDSLINAFRRIAQPFRDGAFLRWLITAFVANMGLRIIMKNLTPYYTYVLGLKGNEFVYFFLALIPFAGVGFWIWQDKAKKIGLKKTYLITAWIIVFALLLSTFIHFIGDKLTRVLVAYVLISIVIMALVAGYVLPTPIVSYFSDNIPDHLKIEGAGESRGNYFGSYIFMLNVANAIGDIILGVILEGPNAKNADIIAWTLPISAIFYFCAIIIFHTIKIEN